MPNTIKKKKKIKGKKRQPIKEKLNRRKSSTDLILMTALTIKHFGECLLNFTINTNARLQAIVYIMQ